MARRQRRFLCVGALFLFLIATQSLGKLEDEVNETELIIVKIGGSSITDKGQKETINKTALDWFATTLLGSIDEYYLSSNHEVSSTTRTNRAFIVVHGAGSFGHHTAKEFNLKGQSTPPNSHDDSAVSRNEAFIRYQMEGLAKTRLSVQRLNQKVVATLVDHMINAVAISPCLAIPQLQAHGGNEHFAVSSLSSAVADALRAGLVPVIHGDACLYGNTGAGILSGDVIVEALATHSLPVTKVLFLTDVDGVFTKDPNLHEDSELLRMIEIDASSGKIVTEVCASKSSHEHDVTGGLETKLRAAARIAQDGTEVVIVKCGSDAAVQAIELAEHLSMDSGTVVRARTERNNGVNAHVKKHS